jgi:hypothetical protein
MKTFTLASFILSSALLTNAQLAYDVATQSLKCAMPSGVYCVGDSLTQSYIAHCTNGIATISCCTAELSSLPPLGLKPTALCFQSSTTTGDASCALNGTIYPPHGPAALPAPVKPTLPIPAVINIADTPPKDCGCHNGTHPYGPAGPTGPIIPPVSPPSGTPVAPIIPPSMPVPPPAASTPVSPVHPTGPGGYDLPTIILPTGTGAAPKPTMTVKSTFSYTIPKPTVTPTASSTFVSPAQATGAAEKRTVPVLAMCALGAVAFLL